MDPFDHTKHGVFDHPSNHKPLRELNPYEASGRIYAMFNPTNAQGVDDATESQANPQVGTVYPLRRRK